MHVRIDQLLNLRDGEPVAAGVADHVERCSACASQLARLQQTQQRLQSLESFDPPPLAWNAIVARTASQPAAHRRRLVLAAAAVVGAVAVAIGIFGRHVAPPAADVPRVATEPVLPVNPAALDQLVEQSRELDEMLQHLPQRPSVERVAMAGTIDTIEQRVQWLDMQLSYAPDSGLNDAQAYRLWRERVDLMDSLVKVRYAESSRMAF